VLEDLDSSIVVWDSVSDCRALAALACWTCTIATATAARARTRASMPITISRVEGLESAVGPGLGGAGVSIIGTIR
jgi:hypothetical protein